MAAANKPSFTIMMESFGAISCSCNADDATTRNVTYDVEKYWLYPTDGHSKLALFRNLRPRNLIAKNSMITSLGSCFADRIRMFLKDKGFRYVMTEENSSGSSANWGRVYNPLSLRQILDYCENPNWRPIERWWVDAQGQTRDPYRAVGPYASERAAEEDFARHRGLARDAFAVADVVILTYGLSEIWESTYDASAFHSRPLGFNPIKHRLHILEYPECLRAVEASCASIRRINPRAIIILTISPVPLRATFRSDVTAVTANIYSKAVLLAAVQTASRATAGIHYFPSYEIVTECMHEPFGPHGSVTAEAVNVVMDVFEHEFVCA